MTTETRSLHRKLAQVMHEAERIPKNGVYDGPGRFKFVQAGDAADVIRKALAEKVISMVPTAIELVSESEHTTSKGTTMTTMTVRTTWTLTDGESGETAVIQSMGSGADAGDKASPKAQTNAMKYALLMGFLLSTGDDPELSDSSDRRPRQPSPTPTRPVDTVTVGTTEVTTDGGLIGTAVTKDRYDMNLRETPDGWVWPFRIKNGSTSFGAVAENELAQALDLIKSTVIDQRVTVWGRWSDEVTPAKGTRPEVKWRLLHVDRIATPDGILPAPGADEPPEDVPLVGEAETAPLFDDVA